MNSSIKQIYASLEICEGEIKLVVAEYFNTRFNVLKVEKRTTNSISDFKVIDREQLKNDINSLVNDCSERIGAKIEQLIIVLPAYNFKRFSISDIIEPETGTITNSDISKAISRSFNSQVDDDVIIVDSLVSKYTINGISTRRIPENETCNEFRMDFELLCADKEIIFDYISVVEECGLNVLDITLNITSIGKESSIFEESHKRNIVCLNIEKYCTYMSLFSKGKIVSNELIFDGLNTFVNQIKTIYDIPENDILKLLKYNVNYHTKYPDDVVYAYNLNGSTKTISTRDLNTVLMNSLDNFINKLYSMCKPILDENTLIFITGEGQQMNSLVNSYIDKINCNVRSYQPDTLGVRDPSLTALFGSLYTYHDKVKLNNINVSCIDLLEYNSHVDQKEIDSEGETITTKIKNLFKQYVEREDSYDN